MMIIKQFQTITKNDVEIAGGKGASLGEMIKAGIPVPAGFVLLSTAFEIFLEQTDLNVEIETILGNVNINKIHTIEEASEKIRTLITNRYIPDSISAIILDEFKKLGHPFVAVRSSATSEDSASAAWAGQLDSFLNTTEVMLLENVKKCWASLFTPRAIFYRFEKKLDKDKISVAVVVQKMVDSEKSGIAFSVHPVTQDKNQIIIEAGFGLGEAIVSGSITPDSYVVDKGGLTISAINRGGQTKALYKNPKGGNEWKELGERGKKQALTEKKIIGLSKLIIKIENHYGFPCDIEWAEEKGKFYITQSRPITTIGDAIPGNQNIFDYIKSQKWFFGVRADESLLFYSAKTGGNDYIKKEYGISFAETILIPLKKNRPIRVFNLSQAKKFHALSNEKILKDPKILTAYIDKNDLTYEKITARAKKHHLALKKDDYGGSVRLFNEIISLYEVASAQFIIIFSLGLKLAENTDNPGKTGSVIKAHDIWRNSVVFKEEAMGENLFRFFKYLITKKKLTTNPLLLMKFLTINEIRAWLRNELTDEAILEKIGSRKNHGFVYLNLKNKNREIIDDSAEIKKMRKYFLKLGRESKKSISDDEISGQVAYNPKALVRGRVVIIKDKSELADKNRLIDGKILVAIQTTPHFIPYVKKAKAIITDEGGITCHAAIVSRELKIPCIIGAGSATSDLKDGDLVEVDADLGIIRIIKKIYKY